MGLPPKDKFCLGFVLNEYLGFDFGLWKFEGGLYALYSCLLSEKTAHARTHREKERERERDPNKRMVVGVVFFVRKRALLDFKREKAVCSIPVPISFLTADFLLPEKEREREIKRESKSADDDKTAAMNNGEREENARGGVSTRTSSRLCIKNLPKHYTEARFRELSRLLEK